MTTLDTTRARKTRSGGGDTPVIPERRLLRAPEAARYLGVSVSSLSQHRYTGTGPLFRKVSGSVYYAVEDLDDWVLSRPAVRSNAELAGAVK